MNELTITEALLPALPPKQEPIRGGAISVDTRVFDSLGISLRDCSTQGALEDKGVFADIRKRLLLPENYTIRFVWFRWAYPTAWQVGVTSPDLPPIGENLEGPILTPIYQRLKDGTTCLKEIRIEKDRWVRTYNPDELTLERL